jgi:hypothetical protein
MILRPQARAWLPLLVVTGPIAALGIFAILEDALIGSALIVLAAVIVGYNGTIRLIVHDGQISLKRYGIIVWSAPTRDISVEAGRGGDIAILPAYVFMRRTQQVGYILRGWFREEDVSKLRELLAKGS